MLGLFRLSAVITPALSTLLLFDTAATTSNNLSVINNTVLLPGSPVATAEKSDHTDFGYESSCRSPGTDLILKYDVTDEASRAGLRSLLYRGIRESKNAIDAGHGKIRVTAPEAGIFKMFFKTMMLYVTDYSAVPGKLTWNLLNQILEAAWFCFVNEGLYYGFKAEVFVKGVYTGFITVVTFPEPSAPARF